MTETMTSRERVFAAFAHEKVDRAPIWQTDSNVWIIDDANLSFADMLAMDDIGADVLIRGFDKLKTDMVTVGAGAWLGWLNAFGCPVEMSKVGVPMEVAPCIKDPETDIPKLEIGAIKELIAGNALCQKILKQARILKEKIGDEKVIQFITGGPFTLANIMVGTEDFMVLLAEEDENVPHILEFIAAATAEMCNQMLEAGCDVIFTAEPNASGDMISQRMYEEIVIPCTRDFLSQLKDCKYHCMHICGQSTQRIANVMEMGFQGLSIDAVVDIKEAMDLTGKRMSMMGNLSPVHVVLQSTPEETYRQALDLALYAGLESGYFMMPGCDVSPRSPLENIEAMLRAARDAADQAGM